MRDVIGLVRLPMRLRALVVAAALLQAGASLLIRVMRLPRVNRIAERLGRCARCRFDARQIAWAVTASSSRVGGTCLTQALAARVLLGWARVPSRLVIGVRRGSPLPEFHAWTETAGGQPADLADAPFIRLVAWS